MRRRDLLRLRELLAQLLELSSVERLAKPGEELLFLFVHVVHHVLAQHRQLRLEAFFPAAHPLQLGERRLRDVVFFQGLEHILLEVRHARSQRRIEKLFLDLGVDRELLAQAPEYLVSSRVVDVTVVEEAFEEPLHRRMVFLEKRDCVHETETASRIAGCNRTGSGVPLAEREHVGHSAPPMKPTVFLFDIDGTLITTGGVGRVAIESAFDRLFGRPDAFESISFAGMTDRAIVRAGLMAIGRKPAEPDIDAAIDAYVAVLEEEVSRADGAKYRVHTGIEAALDVVHGRGSSAIGLGTGNIRAGARVKLERVGLYGRFSFGGFGCDAEDRAELIRIGADRGAKALDTPRESCRVVVIGDTPKDIAAARAIGAESIGVGTGPFAPADLLACGATFACGDLSEPGALDRLLG